MDQNQTLSKPKKSRLGRILGITAIVVVVLLIAGYLAIGAIAANRLTYATRMITDDTPLKHGMNYEDVTFPAREDGLNIAAWYIPVDENPSAYRSPAIVMVHGWNASRTNGFGEHFLDMAKALHDGGLSVLMIDLRGHGKSADSRFTMGKYEQRDVLAAIDYLLERGHQPGKIGVLGTSMGASAVIYAAVDNPAIGAIVTDSLFSDSYTIVKGLWPRKSGLPMIFFYPTRWMFRLENGFDMASIRPIDEIGKLASLPMLMIHCQVDTDVPVEQFYQLQQAAPWAQTWLVQECRHAEIYEFVPDEYNQKVVGFFTENLE